MNKRLLSTVEIHSRLCQCMPKYIDDRPDATAEQTVSTGELVEQIYQPVLQGQEFKEPDIPVLHLMWMILGFFPSMLIAPMGVMELVDAIDQSSIKQIAMSIALTLGGCITIFTWIRSYRIYSREMDAKPEIVNFNNRNAWKRVRDDGNWILTYQLNEDDIQLILTTPKVKEVLSSVTVEGGADLIRTGILKLS